MTDTTHRLDDYDYHLPPDQIAQYPTAQRDQSRLLVLDAGMGDLAHRRFTDITDWLRPGDLMVVNTRTLADNPALGQALAGAWYEVMSIMSADTSAGQAARAHMAAAAGTDLAGYEAQLAATRMFYSASEAVDFTESAALPATMTKVAEFSFKHGLLGEGARSADAVGMSFSGGTTGNAANVKLRFDPTYMRMAADGKLD